ncbi:hypothetical protein N7526_009570 [Penicillium atrosanguineum]|nr:hypothetical protein N7526_009570 [Penicillium atrosanguineum]
MLFARYFVLFAFAWTCSAGPIARSLVSTPVTASAAASTGIASSPAAEEAGGILTVIPVTPSWLLSSSVSVETFSTPSTSPSSVGFTQTADESSSIQGDGRTMPLVVYASSTTPTPEDVTPSSAPVTASPSLSKTSKTPELPSTWTLFNESTSGSVPTSASPIPSSTTAKTSSSSAKLPVSSSASPSYTTSSHEVVSSKPVQSSPWESLGLSDRVARRHIVHASRHRRVPLR